MFLGDVDLGPPCITHSWCEPEARSRSTTGNVSVRVHVAVTADDLIASNTS
jgi:hypothetical protein